MTDFYDFARAHGVEIGRLAFGLVDVREILQILDDFRDPA